MRYKKVSENGSLKKVFIFISLVSFLVFISLSIKFYLLVKRGRFDGVHQLNLAVKAKNESAIISFNPNTQFIYAFLISKSSDFPKFKKTLNLPVDGEISFEKGEILTKAEDIDNLVRDSIFSHSNSNLTVLDFVRLYIFSKTIPSSSISFVKTDQTNTNNIDKITSVKFLDNKISEEKASIEIVNATGVTGLGSKFAKIITNIGGNVISVTSGNEEKKSSISFFGGKTYTLERLSSILKLEPYEMKTPQISDIVIILGKDKESMDIF